MFIANPHWTVFIQNDLLILSAGGDESHVLDEVPSIAHAQQLVRAFTQNDFAALAAHADYANVLTALRHAGAIYPISLQRDCASLGVVWFGDEPLGFRAEWQHQGLPAPLAADQAEVLLLIRTNLSWRDCLAYYQQMVPSKAHFFIDLAYHHTLCLGPYVVPGETACLACLGNRLAYRWGDPPLAEKPAASEEISILCALIRRSLQFNNGTWQTPLAFVERSVSLHLETLQSRSDRIFQLPSCPLCGHSVVATPLSLPWSTPSSL